MRIQVFSEAIHAKRAILGFGGWPDAAGTIEASLAELRDLVPCELVATWDLDGYWQSRVVRPNVQIRHGQIQGVDWPSFHFSLARPAAAEPFILGYGPEPGLNWRRFTEELVDLLTSWGCEELILLGSLYDQIFHDEVMISAVVQDPSHYNLARDLGCEPIDYSGPGAVHAAIMERTGSLPLRSVSVWAHMPFYLETPHELLMARCIQVAARMAGLEVQPIHLEERWREREREIEDMVSNNQQLRQSIEEMRSQRERREVGKGPKVVSLGDFLKRKQDGPRDDGA